MPAVGNANDTLGALAALLVGGAAGALVAARTSWPLGLVALVLVTTLLAAVLLRRTVRRWRLSRRPFPAAWRAVLQKRVEAYRRLSSDAERARFEDEVRFFIAEQVISGPRGASVSDEIKVLVAASAVILSFGRRGFRWPTTRDVVVYDEAFDEEYQSGKGKPILGMVHGTGAIVLSARDLLRGFDGAHDGLNVGLHEMAHVLDFDVGHADGAPSFVPWGAMGPWMMRVHDEIRRVKRNRSVLRQYAATNEAELFAVATEAFFERPVELSRKHPALYAMLREAYGQDPARPKGQEERDR